MGKKILLITLIGLVLRLINIGQSFWLDEAAQLVMSQNSLNWIWFFRSADFHPPLFYFLTHTWMLVSHSEQILRLLPVTFGVLSIPAIYLLVSKLFSRKTAILSALFLAINPYLVYYSQEMRSYSLMVFLAIMAIYFLTRKQWLWLLITNTLLVYTHYSSFFLLLSQLTYVLFYNQENLRKLISNYVLLILSFLPWLPQFLNQLKSGVNIDQYLPGWRAELTLPLFKSIPLIFFKFTAGRIDLYPNWIYLVYIVFILCLIFFILYLARKSYPLLTIWLVLPLFISLALSFWIPQTQPFRLIYCLPSLLIYFAVAAKNHPRKVITLLLYVAFVGNFLQITRPRLQREQWRQATDYLNSENIPVIVKFPDKFATLYWYNLVPPSISAYPDFTSPSASSVMLMEYMSGISDPKRQVESRLLSLGFREVSARDFSGVGIIRKYVLPR